MASESSLYPELQKLASLVDEQPESFASGNDNIQKAALDAAKLVFDLAIQSEPASLPQITELLASLEPALGPLTRSQSRTNEKKGAALSLPRFATTPLTSLFVEGMDEDQIWAQLDLRAKNVCDALDFVLEGGPDEDEDEDGSEEDEEEEEDEDFDDERLRAILKSLENGEDVEFDALCNDMDVDDQLDEGYSDESEDEDEEREEDDSDGMGSELEEEGEEGIMELRDPEEDSEDDSPSSMLDVIGKHTILKRKGKGHPELDDGFFDLSAFNVESERAEARSSSKGRLGGDEDSDSDDISIDLFAPVDQDSFDEEDEENDAGAISYKDFFDPPRLAGSKSKAKMPGNSPIKTAGRVRFNDQVTVRVLDKGKRRVVDTSRRMDGKKKQPIAHSFAALTTAEEDEEEDEEQDGDDEDGIYDSRKGLDDNQDDEGQDVDETRRTIIERSKDDLFAEEVASNQDLSTHQRRMSELQVQISELESENVGPKDWVLMGEADSRKRPQNSLLEEDLEFERAMKTVPVVTEEAVRNLEERIKARILEGRFDDVVRVKATEDKPFLPSRYFELKDTKSTQSLAQIYEDEFVATQTGGVAGEDRDGKLKKEHEEVEQLWEKISHKLDALCNTHFMPKQSKAIISTISNVSTATLESALPTTQSTSTLLAPEEVFAPSTSEPRAHSEMTPTQKKALHNKQRKARKKLRDELEKKVDKYAKVRGISGVKKQKQAALESVVKSGKGVTVVGKPKEALKRKDKVGRSKVG